jgi:subtilisin family serine protease
VDVVAPGVDVFATELAGWSADSGTSFAAPIASGVLGLIWSVSPAFPPDVAEAVLLLAAEDLGPPGEDATFGTGVVDAARAVEYALAASSGTLPPFALDDLASGPSGTELVIDVLANDVDLAGHPLAISAFDTTSAKGGAVHLQLVGDSEVLVYSSPAGFEGEDEFGYQLADGPAESAATVRVLVVDVALFEPPIAFDVAGFSAPQALRARDFDGDGDLDLALRVIDLALGTRLVLFEAEGGLLAGGAPIDLAPGLLVDFDLVDFGADGCMDLVVSDRIAGTLEVRPGDCDGGFQAGTSIPVDSPRAVTAVSAGGEVLDFNGDGAADVALVTAGFPTSVQTWLGDGAGALAPSGSLGTVDVPATVAAGDMTGDGAMDVVGLGDGGIADGPGRRRGHPSRISCSRTSMPTATSTLLRCPTVWGWASRPCDCSPTTGSGGSPSRRRSSRSVPPRGGWSSPTWTWTAISIW